MALRKVAKTTKKNLGKRATPQTNQDISVHTQNENISSVRNYSSKEEEDMCSLTSRSSILEREDNLGQSGSTEVSKNLAGKDPFDKMEEEGEKEYHSDEYVTSLLLSSCL